MVRFPLQNKNLLRHQINRHDQQVPNPSDLNLVRELLLRKRSTQKGILPSRRHQPSPQNVHLLHHGPTRLHRLRSLQRFPRQHALRHLRVRSRRRHQRRRQTLHDQVQTSLQRTTTQPCLPQNHALTNRTSSRPTLTT